MTEITPNARISRRALLLGSAALGGALWCEARAVSALDTTELLEVNEFTVPIAGLHEEFDGYRIAFISDTHLGVSVRTDFVRQALKSLIDRSPDVLVLGGDLIWTPSNAVFNAVAPVRNHDFATVRRADLPLELMRAHAELLGLAANVRDGVFAVLGNHDRRHPPHVCIDPLIKNGVRVLVNEVACIKRGAQKLYLVGVDDYWEGRPKMPNLPTDAPSILLAHNPGYLLDVVNKTKLHFPFALCGHTHGGQMRIPPLGLRPLWRVPDMRLVEGFCDLGAVRSFTSRGVGVSGGLNYRIDCNPEVNIFNLTPSVKA